MRPLTRFLNNLLRRRGLPSAHDGRFLNTHRRHWDYPGRYS